MKISDEDYSSTRGAMEGMLKYGDNGALPDLYADSIRDGEKKDDWNIAHPFPLWMTERRQSFRKINPTT